MYNELVLLNSFKNLFEIFKYIYETRNSLYIQFLMYHMFYIKNLLSFFSSLYNTNPNLKLRLNVQHVSITRYTLKRG